MIDPYWLVGIKGLYCLLLSVIIIPLISMISCPFGKIGCVIDDNGKMVLENFNIFLRESFENPIILTGIIIFVISLVTYTVIGAIIAKKIGSLARSVIDISTSFVVWVIGIAVALTLGKNNLSFRWESLHPLQLLGQSLGFGILVYGNLIYYEVVLPFWSESDHS